MNEAVFISDLHLNLQQPEISERFNHFLEWAKVSTASIYILGDFFHVWFGDDMMTEFELSVAKSLAELNERGINVYWMPGNRDFLVGKKFIALSRVQLLEDPSIIMLKGMRLMLTHGDAYCLHDYGHQLLRILTRSRFSKWVILSIPKQIRIRCIQFVRNFSQDKKKKPIKDGKKYHIVQKALFKQMWKYKLTNVVYGHIHKPSTKTTNWKNKKMTEYILSDWDTNPTIFCYNVNKGMHNLSTFGL